MVSCVFAFCLLCLFFGRMVQMTESQMFSSVHPESRFISAQVGGNLTLKCFHDGDRSARLYWFKQNLGRKPKIISHFFKYNVNNSSNEELKNNPRFTLDTQDGKYHLTIRDLKCSDSAIYYCVYYLYTLTFLETIIVSVKGSGVNIKAVVQQSASETIQPGGSVTLNCTVHTGTCDGEHSVYWFRDSDESHPGLIYKHLGRNDQCDNKPSTQTHTCVYSLPMSNLNVSHAGTVVLLPLVDAYYLETGPSWTLNVSNITNNVGVPLSLFWTGAFAFTSILSVLVAFLQCMMSKNCGCKSSESQTRASNEDAKDFQEAKQFLFAPSSVKLDNRSRSQRDQTWTECVYYSVKLQRYTEQ